MARAETWSGKEYRGFVYACDMGGVFDVDGFTRCENAICVGVPANASGPAGCGAWLELAELLILRGTWAGGTANFRFGVDYVAGRPSGELTYNERRAGVAFVLDATDTSATFTGSAAVDGRPGVPFRKVDDVREPGSADTFTITLGTSAASGVLRIGNVGMRSGSR